MFNDWPKNAHLKDDTSRIHRPRIFLMFFRAGRAQAIKYQGVRYMKNLWFSWRAYQWPLLLVKHFFFRSSQLLLCSVSDPWRVFWVVETAPFKGPRLTLCFGFWSTEMQDNRTECLACDALRSTGCTRKVQSQYTVKNNYFIFKRFCVCYKRTYFRISENWARRAPLSDSLSDFNWVMSRFFFQG